MLAADSPVAPAEVFMFQVEPANWRFYDYDALTTVALFGGTGPDAMDMVCHARLRGVRSVAGAPLQSSQLHNATYIDTFIEGMRELVNGSALGLQLDGINFDVEDPLSGADAAALTAAVARTSAALKQSMGRAFQVSVDVAWSPKCIDGRCYDFKGLSEHSDLLFVMAYDMRSQVRPPAPCIASANSPFPGVEDGMLAFEALGIAPSKLVLGLPWYGYRYPCLTGTAPDAATCPIASVPFRNVSCSDAAGSEVCYSGIRALLRNASHPPARPLEWNATLAAPFFNMVEEGAAVQYWYDNPRSLALKYAYAKAQGWRGVGSWNVDCLAYNSTLPQEREDTSDMWRAIAGFRAPAPPPRLPRMAALSAAFVDRELGYLARHKLNGTAVRDLAAAAWVLLATGSAASGGAPPQANATAARSALDAVFAAQLPTGQWVWAFGDAKDLDANSVQFTALPVLRSVIHFGGALGAAAVRGWMPRIAMAAVASYEEGVPGAEAQPFYTNIATMRMVNLFMFAQVTGNATVRAQADAALAAWTALVDAAGVHEYLSPTYTAVAIQNLFAGAGSIEDAAVAATLRKYGEYLLAVSAAAYFAPSASMAGPHSRDYDFIFGSAGMDWVYAALGFPGALDADVQDQDPITMSELYADAVRGDLGAPPPSVLALAAPPLGSAWRLARASFLPTPGNAAPVDGADYSIFTSAVASLGVASLYYGPQDKMVSALLPLAAGHAPPLPSPRLAQVTLVQDSFDAPYGSVKTPDGSGHEKPTHLKATVAAVQDAGLALVLNDLTMGIERQGNFTSLAANVLFPAGGGVEGVYVDGQPLANRSGGAPEVPLRLGATVAVRSGGGVVAFRVPWADGVLGFTPTSALKFDGPPGSGAARLVTYLYRGTNVSFGASPPPSRSILLIAVGAAGSDAEAAAFSAALAGLRVTNAAADPSAWRVTVAPAGAGEAAAGAAPAPPPGFSSVLAAELCVPTTKKILARTINGTALRIPRGGVLEVARSDGTVEEITPGAL